MMENGLKFMLSLAVAAGLTSCIQEQADTEIQDKAMEVTFSAYSDEAETKTTLHSDGRSVHWGTTDRIMVFAGTTKGSISEQASVQSDPKKAEFKVKTTLADTYHAIYPPYEDATYSADCGYITTVLPTQQTPVKGSFADGTNLTVAKSEGSNLYFRNVGALLAVKNPSNYASAIKVVSKDENAKMSGEAVIDYNNGNPVIVSAENGRNHVEFTSGLANTKDQVFHYVVYPGKYSGFDIIITSAGSPWLKAIYSSSKELDLKRNDNCMLFELPEGKFAWNSIAGPTSVNAYASGWKEANVSWSWNYSIPAGETDPRAGYKIYVRKSGSTEIINTIEVNSASTFSTTVTGLEIDKRYDFGVQTLKTSGKPSEIVWKSDVWINGNKCIPPTPVSIEQISETQVTFTWKDNTGAEKNYMIWKKETRDGKEIINTATVAANVTTYTTGVTAGNTYEFGVQALHQDNSDNNSEITYFDPYVALTWYDLLSVDMGANECLKPEQVAISVNGQQATITWECYSSAATGFNVFIREEGQNWSKDFCASKAKADRSHTFYKQLEYGKTYYLGVQSVNSASMSRNSGIVEKKVCIVKPTTELFDWEKNRKGAPKWSDMTLCYGGDLWRVPTYWNKERFASHALYTDKNGQLQYLFDAFLALDFSMKGYTLNYDDSGNKSARKEEWTSLINYWFDDTYGFQALDDCIEEAAQKIGPPKTKRYVVFVLPDPIYCEVYTDKSSSKTYWGKYEDGTTANFSTEDGRVRAYKWMIDQVRAKFASMNYRHLELAGFYILQETLSASWNDTYKKWSVVLPKVGTYLDGYNEGFYWIPYGYSVNKTGYSYDSGHNEAIKGWDDFGFDLAVLQPNMYWDYKGGRSWYTTCETYINGYDMGMEIEFEGTHGENLATCSSILEYKKDGTKNPEGYNNRERLRRYFENAKEYGIYGKKPIVLYSGSDAMHELASSENEKDKIIYHELCQFIIGAKH